MFSSKLSVGLVALALVSAGSIGCAADTSPEGDGTDVEESADELTAAGKKLIGSYKDDSGAFKSLVLSTKKVGQRNVFSADVDTGIRCIKAPCPSAEHIEGTFTAGSKTITLYSTTASQFSQHLLGKYNYLVQGAKFSLSRKDFAQSLERLADIWPSDATKLVAKQSGGFMPPPPAGSTCTNQHEYSLTLATRKLSYSSCEFNGNLPRTLKTGTVTLTSAQLAKVNAAMNAVEISTGDICGADKPFETLAVTSPAGEKKYVDSFYSCQGSDNVYIDNIGGVFGALRDAAGH